MIRLWQTSGVTTKLDSLELFEFFIDIDKSTLKLESDTVWFAIDNLEIVINFSQELFKAGIFLYLPSVGGFSPKSAKWIGFLCR